MGVSCVSCAAKSYGLASGGGPSRRSAKGAKYGSRTKDHKGTSEGPNGQKTKRRIPSPDTAQPLATTEIHAHHLEAFPTSLRRRCAAYRRRTNM
jgi:hypothetical protein